MKSNLKILFFIDSLYAGGKERRLIEFLCFLKEKTNYELLLVITEDQIQYKDVFELNIQIKVLKRRWSKKDPSIFYKFYKIAKRFQPDIIHAWGRMVTFYAVPTKVLLKIPLISNAISDTKRTFRSISFDNLIFRIICFYSDIIVANSKAGISAYGIQSKKVVNIYNGVRLQRFNITPRNEELRKEFKINTKYIVIMVASLSPNKNYNLFIDIVKATERINKDVTFIGVGDGPDYKKLQSRVINERINNIIFTGFRYDVEDLIMFSDIGLLLTYSEGISNAIIEYMALAKPVISTDLFGGSKELIINEQTGYILNPNVKIIVERIIKLLEDEEHRLKLGARGKEIIREKFSIERMGNEYVELYRAIL